MALGYLYGSEALGGPGVPLSLAESFVRRLPPEGTRVVRAMVGRSVNCPRASSAGRLFGAAASLIGLCDDATYEGQAAVALESAAGDERAESLPWRLARADGLWVYDPVPTLTALLEGQGLRVLVGSAVPVNDGGISYGQAAVAAARLREA